MKIYLCIHCKKEFKKIPEKVNNECRNGYFHKFINKEHIIER